MATSTSHFVKTVCVKDWWLIKADNDSLHNTVAVAGIESAGQQAARVFVSAPIVKRLDLFTLKTADGIFVLLKGLINKERTCDNGFSEEVFKHFLIGFPSNWESCAEKCLQQGIGSEDTVDADINPDEAQEATTELQDDQNTDSVEERMDLDSNNMPEHFTVGAQETTTYLLDDQNVDSVEVRKDLDFSNMPGHFTDEAQEATIKLRDDQNIESVEERSFRGASSSAQDHNKDRHSNVGFREEGVRYSLRNRKVPCFEAKGACKGKHVIEVAKTQPFSKKTTIGAEGISTMPSVTSLENPQAPGTAPLGGESSKEKADHPKFAASGGVNDADNAEYIAANRYMSVAGETLAVENSMHRREKAQESHQHDDMPPILQDASKAKNSISHHSSVGKSCKSKKRKRVERRIPQKNTVSTRPLLKKTGQNTKAFSPQDADKLVNSTSHDICMEKSDRSKKERKQRSILTSTTADIKNYHDSARPTPRTCTSKTKSNSKAAAPGLEGKASTVSTPKFGTRRKLVYAEKTTCTTDGENKEAPTSRKENKTPTSQRENKTPTSQRENKTPTSRSLVIRTSRSGRLLLPTMEFWRNQLPIYDADHGISGIQEGSTILKIKRVRESHTKKSRRLGGRSP